MPKKTLRHSILLLINFTYSEKLYPIVNRFKYITIYDKLITVRPKPNKNKYDFKNTLSPINILLIIFKNIYIIY